MQIGLKSQIQIRKYSRYYSSLTVSEIKSKSDIYFQQTDKGPFTPSVSVNAVMTLATLQIENRSQPHSGATLFVSTDFNENYVASVTVALTLTLGINGP